MPKVSVIVAAYNVEQYIQKCLLSILSQTLKEIQIIVIDDGSSDSTAQKISELQNDRIEYHKKENGGLSDARNFGLQFVKGEYLAFVDGDDFVEPDMYEILYNTAKKRNSDLVECEYFKDYGNYIIPKKHGEPDWQKVKFYPAYQFTKLILTNSLVNCNIRFKKNLWYEDFNFNLKFASVIKNAVHIDTPLYHYVQRSSSIMHTIDERIFDIYKGIEDVIAFYKANNLYEDYYADLEYIIVRELLLSASERFLLYDNQHKTFFFKKNYEYCMRLFPRWKKNKYLHGKGVVNLCLKYMNRFTYKPMVVFISKTKTRR